MTDNRTYTAIQDWMLDLGLDIYGVLAYAVIFGFSQDGESTFTGSLSYLARKMCCSRITTIRTLNEMVEKGIIEKIVVNKNGVRFCEYRALLPDTGSISQIPGGSISEIHNIIDIENIDIERVEEKKSRSPRFVKPSVEEVREYCASRGNSIDPEEFVDFYESKGWMIGKSPMKSWQAAVRTWEKSKNNSRPSARPSRAPRPASDVYSRNAAALEEVHRRLGFYNNPTADEQ